MPAEYTKLLGNRVYVDIDIPKYTIEMAEEVKKQLVGEAVKSLTKAVVYDVGSGVVEGGVEPGDIVLVSKEGVLRGDLINLTDKKTVLLISPFDIIHIW